MFRLAVCLAVGLLVSAPVSAQQVGVGVPSVGVQNRFFEQFQVGWGFQRRTPNGSMFFQFGGPANPPFGGFNPNVGANFGAAQRWGNGELFFNFSAAQGYSSSLSMTAPSVTLTNGVPGFVQDVTIRPFVTGVIPVVGDAAIMPFPVYPVGPLVPPVVTPVLTSPVLERLARLRHEPKAAGPQDLEAPAAGPMTPNRRDSTAQRGEVSIAEIRRQQAAEDAAEQAELERIIAEGRAAEESGQRSIARVRYRQAAARVDGQRRQELLQAVERLSP
jgi:hypothetical protein